MKQIFLISCFFIAVSAVSSENMETYGNVEARTAVSFMPAENEKFFTGISSVTLRHTLPCSMGAFNGSHRLSVSPGSHPEYRVLTAYMSLYLTDNLTVFGGKQLSDPGLGFLFTGYSLSTGSSMPAGEQADYLGITSVLNFGISGSWETVFSFEEALTSETPHFWENFVYQTRISWFLPPVELAFTGGYRYEENLRAAGELRLQAGDFTFYLSGAGEFINSRQYPVPSGNGIIRQNASGTVFPLFTGGIQWNRTGSVSFSAAAEYRFDSRGYTGNELDLILSLPPETETGFTPGLLGKHYSAFSFTADMSGFMRTNHTGLLNLTDLSGVFNHSFTLTVLRNIDFFITLNWYAGEAGLTEFGSYPALTEPPGRITAGAGTRIHF
ncbi:MAG: hypothetical protein ACLFST_09300 [Spirochaetia bacterium]